MKRVVLVPGLIVATALALSACVDLEDLPDRPNGSTDTDTDTDTDVDTDIDTDTDTDTDCDPAWTEHTVDGAFSHAQSVYSADVDGDGDMDVLGAAHEDDDITWWENTAGDGTAWTERTVDGAFDGAWSVYAADVDGDGDMDVLGAAQIAGDITWWESDCIP